MMKLFTLTIESLTGKKYQLDHLKKSELKTEVNRAVAEWIHFNAKTELRLSIHIDLEGV